MNWANELLYYGNISVNEQLLDVVAVWWNMELKHWCIQNVKIVYRVRNILCLIMFIFYDLSYKMYTVIFEMKLFPWNKFMKFIDVSVFFFPSSHVFVVWQTVLNYVYGCLSSEHSVCSDFPYPYCLARKSWRKGC